MIKISDEIARRYGEDELIVLAGFMTAHKLDQKKVLEYLVEQGVSPMVFIDAYLT